MIGIILIGIVALIALINEIHFIMAAQYIDDKEIKLENVKYEWLWILIHCTWALPSTIIGCLVALCLLLCGRRPMKYGWCWCFEFNIHWGFELGMFFIAPKESEQVKQHEHGHGIQYLYFGPLSIIAITIPSLVRFWFRKIIKKIKKDHELRPYDDIWFEKQATNSGKYFIEKLKERKK